MTTKKKLKKNYGPGTLGCHEAFDRASLLTDLVYQLADHESIKMNPQWTEMAQKAGDQLFDLYSAIAKDHTKKKEKKKKGD